MNCLVRVVSFALKNEAGGWAGGSKKVWILSGVPQGSILGAILFKMLINDLLMRTKNTKNSELYKFADDNTILSLSGTLIITANKRFTK